jgi:hypothetical protein
MKRAEGAAGASAMQLWPAEPPTWAGFSGWVWKGGRATYVDDGAGPDGGPVPLRREMLDVPARQLGPAVEEGHVSARGGWVFREVLEHMLVARIGEVEGCRRRVRLVLLLPLEALSQLDENGGDLVRAEQGHVPHVRVDGERGRRGRVGEDVGRGLAEHAVGDGVADGAGEHVLGEAGAGGEVSEGDAGSDGDLRGDVEADDDA